MFIVVFFCYLFTVVVNITDGMRSVCEDEKQALDHREVADDRRDILQSLCEAEQALDHREIADRRDIKQSVCEAEQALDRREVTDDRRDIMQSVCEAEQALDRREVADDRRDIVQSLCQAEEALDHREVADDRRDIMQSVCEADRDTSDAGAVELADEDLDNTEPDSDESCGSRELFGDISEDDSNGIGYEDLNDVMCPLSQVYLSCKP